MVPLSFHRRAVARMLFCQECGQEMPSEVARRTGVVCQACGLPEERVRRRRRDAVYCGESCRHFAYRQRQRAAATARVEARRKIEDRIASLIG
jgi:hypothetical protein